LQQKSEKDDRLEEGVKWIWNRFININKFDTKPVVTSYLQLY